MANFPSCRKTCLYLVFKTSTSVLGCIPMGSNEQTMVNSEAKCLKCISYESFQALDYLVMQRTRSQSACNWNELESSTGGNKTNCGGMRDSCKPSKQDKQRKHIRLSPCCGVVPIGFSAISRFFWLPPIISAAQSWRFDFSYHFSFHYRSPHQFSQFTDKKHLPELEQHVCQPVSFRRWWEQVRPDSFPFLSRMVCCFFCAPSTLQ